MNYLLKNTDNKILKNEGNTLLQATDGMPEPILDLDANAAEMQSNYTDKRVPTWYDSSGRGHNAQQNEEEFQPVYRTNQLNSLPVVEFAKSYLRLLYALRTQTLFLVYQDAIVDGVSNVGPVFLGYSGAINYNPGGSSTIFSLSPPHPASMRRGVHNMAYLNQGEGINIYIDSENARLLRPPTYVLLTIDLLNHNIYNEIGRQVDLWNFIFSGSIARLIIYDQRLTPLQRIAKRDELMTLYNL